MNTNKSLLILLIVSFLFPCNENKKISDDDSINQILFFGGDILTMVGENPNYLKLF